MGGLFIQLLQRFAPYVAGVRGGGSALPLGIWRIRAVLRPQQRG